MADMTRRTFVKGMTIAGVAASSTIMAGCSATSPNDETARGTFNEGSYTDSAVGKNGEITVEAVFTAEQIDSVVILTQSETEGIATGALEKMPGRIVEAQSLAVDVVSGATLTSMGILQAVRGCAEQAGGDLSALEMPLPEPAASQETLACDVLVIGAGGAGLVSAYCAAKAGVKVVLVEKQDEVGGSSRLNGAMVLAPATDEEHTKHGLLNADELVQFYESWSFGPEFFDRAMVADFVNQMNPNLEWLRDMGFESYRYNYKGWLPFDPTDENGDVIKVIIACRELKGYDPNNVTGWSSDDPGIWPDGIGWEVTNPLYAACQAAGVTTVLGTTITGFVSEDGLLMGATAKSSQNVEYEIEAKAVILASGGFGGNADMREKWWGSAEYAYAGTPACDGAVIDMAAAAGADTRFAFTEGLPDDYLYNSVGGVLIDRNTNVLDTEGNPLPNLFAAGEIADIRFLNAVYPICGSFIQWYTYLGRIAGANAAAAARM